MPQCQYCLTTDEDAFSDPLQDLCEECQTNEEYDDDE
jgi:hypothetical protein